MRFHAKLCLLLCLAATPAAVAQQKQETSDRPHPVTRKDPSVPRKAAPSRLLTHSDGLAILGAALDFHHQPSASDCSHLVHGLYARAGFPYEYASSSDLYVGIDEFRRVANPQPGDLAVWPGHAGIVINPIQHSFFSVLSSGPGVETYDSPYWKQRGQPHFFRYIKPARSGARPSPIQRASLKPAAMGKAVARASNAQATVHEASEKSTSENESHAKLVGKSISETDLPAELAESQRANLETPPVAIVSSARPKPDQVGAAFLKACNNQEESLRGRDLFASSQTVIVFDHVVIKKLHIAGNQSWVEVQIHELLSRTGSKAEVHKGSERQRWPLSRRDNQSWELTPSRNTIYLPQHLAERVLAHELAQLTEDNSDPASRTREKAELARLLNVLLEK